MADYVPTVRVVHPGRFFLSLVPLTLLIAGSFLAFQGDTLQVAAVVWTYVVLVLASRRIQLLHHRRGMRVLRRRAWDEAIGHFKKSYDYFSRHPKLDHHRWLYLSAGELSLCEMALLNMAFCAAQAGRRAEAQALYERVLVEFPGSPLAITSLNLMRDAPPAPGQPGQPG